MVKPKQLGHIVLRVRDLERSEQFYSDVLGLHVTNKRPGQMTFMSAVDESSHELALVPVGDDAPGPEDSRVGLYHFAWQMDSFDDLKRFYARRYEVQERRCPGDRRPRTISLGTSISSIRTATRSRRTMRCRRMSGPPTETCSKGSFQES